MPRMLPFYVCRHVATLNSFVSDLKESHKYRWTLEPGVRKSIISVENRPAVTVDLKS